MELSLEHVHCKFREKRNALLSQKIYIPSFLLNFQKIPADNPDFKQFNVRICKCVNPVRMHTPRQFTVCLELWTGVRSEMKYK